MSIDYLPDEMDALASKLGYNGVHPQFADGLVVGWRAACEAMHKKAQAKAGPHSQGNDNEQQHTPEPWFVTAGSSSNSVMIRRGSRRIEQALAQVFYTKQAPVSLGGCGSANAARIVACVNAMKGISNPGAFRLKADADAKARHADGEDVICGLYVAAEVECNEWRRICQMNKAQDKTGRVNLKLMAKGAISSNSFEQAIERHDAERQKNGLENLSHVVLKYPAAEAARGT
jgi:hypothetical protein